MISPNSLSRNTQFLEKFISIIRFLRYEYGPSLLKALAGHKFCPVYSTVVRPFCKIDKNERQTLELICLGKHGPSAPLTYAHSVMAVA